LTKYFYVLQLFFKKLVEAKERPLLTISKIGRDYVMMASWEISRIENCVRLLQKIR